MTTRKTASLSLTLLALTLGQPGCVWDQYFVKKETSTSNVSKPKTTGKRTRLPITNVLAKSHRS